MAKKDDPKGKFIPRDLSWLQFNRRVLEEAADKGNPLLERTRFLAIFSNNMDEFLMIRLAGIIRYIDAEYNVMDFSGYYPSELLELSLEEISSMYKKLYKLYHQNIRDLSKHQIFIHTIDELNPAQARYVKKYFDSTLYPIMTPMAVDQGRPFPMLPSKKIALAVQLMKREESNFAIMHLPENLPRAVKLPSASGAHHFILIEEIIRAYLDKFFRGYKIENTVLFRIMRDSDIPSEEEYEPNILQAINKTIKKRYSSKVVWLEVEKNSDKELLEGLSYSEQNVNAVDGPLDLSFLFGLISQIPKSSLNYDGFLPVKKKYENIFELISEGDFFLDLPYESFEPTVELIRAASVDDAVLGIKMTLYRTDENSAIIRALKDASSRGKEVTVLVEVKARFDEERNLKWVRELEDARCHVMYGIAGMKVHSKLTMIVRREEGTIKRYVHLSTGNYNEKTARIYSDIGYFTSDDEIGKDVSNIFNVITGYSMPGRLTRFVTAPKDMRKYFFELIESEIDFHRKKGNGLIFAKMNSIEDPQIIDKLYEASKVGVSVKLIVRGICCLRPNIPGLSETIEVKSIVGRFLEHSRIFLFGNNNDFRVFTSSADWMRRNLERRIELLFEIVNPELKEKLKYILDIQWKDQLKSRYLLADGSYTLPLKDPGSFCAQDFMIEHYKNGKS